MCVGTSGVVVVVVRFREFTLYDGLTGWECEIQLMCFCARAYLHGDDDFRRSCVSVALGSGNSLRKAEGCVTSLAPSPAFVLF